MFEDGHWRQGGTHGRDWQNVATAGGRAFAVNVSPGYDDCVAVRDNFNNAKHIARGTIRRDSSYQPSNNPETELIVGATILTGSIRLYEFLWALKGEWQIVRWNGPIGDFNFSLPVTGPGPGRAPVNGDRIEMRYDATNTNDVVITCYLNGTLIATAHDTTSGRILTGNPGLSFYSKDTVSNLSRYCFEDWSCSTS